MLPMLWSSETSVPCFVADEGLFAGKKDEAELMKIMITEGSYRSEKKFCEPLNIQSYHNYVGASNHHKAVSITSDDRRFWLKITKAMKYTDDKWSNLWSLVNNSTVREIFFQYLRTCVDTSIIKMGMAPMTSAKADAASQQCPVGIKWLKTVIFEQPAAAACVPASVGEDFTNRTAWDDDKDRMTFKPRGATSNAMRNLLGAELEEAALKQDFAKRSKVTCVLPLSHISKLVAKQFAGQSWMRINEDDIKRDFITLGAEIKPALLAGKVRRNMVVFPSIDGIIHQMIKTGWMTKDEAHVTEEE